MVLKDTYGVNKMVLKDTYLLCYSIGYKIAYSNQLHRVIFGYPEAVILKSC